MSVYQPPYKSPITGVTKKSRYWWYDFVFSGHRVQRCSGETSREKARRAERFFRRSLEMAYNDLSEPKRPENSRIDLANSFHSFPIVDRSAEAPGIVRDLPAKVECQCVEKRGALSKCVQSEVIAFNARGVRYRFTAPSCCIGFWYISAKEYVNRLDCQVGVRLLSERWVENVLERHYGHGGFPRSWWPAPAYEGDNWNSVYWDIRAFAVNGRFPPRPKCCICDLPFRALGSWPVSHDNLTCGQVGCRAKLWDLVELDAAARRDHRVKEILLHKFVRIRMSKERQCLKTAREQLIKVRRLLRTNFNEDRAACS